MNIQQNYEHILLIRFDCQSFNNNNKNTDKLRLHYQIQFYLSNSISIIQYNFIQTKHINYINIEENCENI